MQRNYPNTPDRFEIRTENRWWHSLQRNTSRLFRIVCLTERWALVKYTQPFITPHCLLVAPAECPGFHFPNRTAPSECNAQVVLTVKGRQTPYKESIQSIGLKRHRPKKQLPTSVTQVLQLSRLVIVEISYLIVVGSNSPRTTVCPFLWVCPILWVC